MHLLYIVDVKDGIHRGRGREGGVCMKKDSEESICMRVGEKRMGGIVSIMYEYLFVCFCSTLDRYISVYTCFEHCNHGCCSDD